MPKRFCICTGCPACGKGCRRLYDRDTAPGQRCPPCQAHATRQRQARPNTTARGYGSEHQALRAQLLAAFQPGQPCARCGKPIRTKGDADLGHADDRSGYRGLEHRRCNRGGKPQGQRPRRRP